MLGGCTQFKKQELAPGAHAPGVSARVAFRLAFVRRLNCRTLDTDSLFCDIPAVWRTTAFQARRGEIFGLDGLGRPSYRGFRRLAEVLPPFQKECLAMQLSARNVLKGTVKSVVHGAVNSEVTVQLPGGQELVSVITKSSAERLGLAEGKEIRAVIKASSVMIGVE